MTVRRGGIKGFRRVIIPKGFITNGVYSGEALFRKINKGRYSENEIRGVIPKMKKGALSRK